MYITISYAYVIKSKVNSLKVKCHTAISLFAINSNKVHMKNILFTCIHVVDNIYLGQAGILKVKLVLLHTCAFWKWKKKIIESITCKKSHCSKFNWIKELISFKNYMYHTTVSNKTQKDVWHIRCMVMVWGCVTG